MKKSIKIAFFSILIIVQIIDVLTTIFIVSTGGIELNPFGYIGTIIMKILTTLLFGIIYFSNKDSIFEKYLFFGLNFAIIFIIIVFSFNFYQISLYLKYIQVN